MRLTVFRRLTVAEFDQQVPLSHRSIFDIRSERGADTYGICLTGDKKYVLDMIKGQPLVVGDDTVRFPWIVRLPCGSAYIFETATDIPTESIPCPCGNPKHWILRWFDAVKELPSAGSMSGVYAAATKQ